MIKSTLLKLVFIILILIQSCGKRELSIYVSQDGNDNESGDISNPIATLQKAVEITKNYAGKIPVTINISEGEYYITKPIFISEEYLGNEQNPIVWRAATTVKPTISGGLNIKAIWQKESNGLLSTELPKNYKSRFRSLYVNGKRAIRARYPDTIYLRIEKAGQDNKTNFYFNSKDFPFVQNIKNLELVFFHDWSITRIGVKEIDWKKNNLVTVDSIGARSPSFFTISNWEEHPRYYLENALEFCNQPGEWFCDFENRKIFYYPLPNESAENIDVVIPIAQKLLTITGNKKVSKGYLKFEGITFEHSNWNIPESGYCGIQACMFDNRSNQEKKWDKVPAAIEVDFAQNITFNNCIIRHTDESGIWFRENCSNCKISNSHIYDIAGNGIAIGEGQDRTTNGIPWWKASPKEISDSNEISNSLIENCGTQFYGAVGIWCGLVSNTTIDHNLIRNLPYTGISVGWMWDTISTPCKNNIINSNYIHHVMNKLSDGGGIYFLGKQPGSKITNNIIHDVKINAGRAESNGMFLDEGITDLEVSNNIIYNIAQSPIRFHRASKNIVEKNVLVCGENIPPIRYNRTTEEDIIKIDNLILKSTSRAELNKLNKLTQERLSEFDSTSFKKIF